MASTIDFTTLAVGTLIGVGCRKQLKSAAKITATAVASLAGAAAIAAAKASGDDIQVGTTNTNTKGGKV